MQPRRNGREASGAVLVAVIGIACALVPTSPAVAADGVTLTADLGVRGSVAPGASSPVRVTVTADRTVRGTVRASVTNGPNLVDVERDLTLVAGTTKSFWLVLPGSAFFGGGGGTGVAVTLQEEGDRATKVDAIGSMSGTLVGVLPRLAGDANPPANVEMKADLGQARTATLSPDLMELGPGALMPFANIAGTSADLAGLSAPARTSLLIWLNRGGRLLVDDDPSGQLPTEWMPPPDGTVDRATAGSGEVRLTRGALTRGEWAASLQPGTVDDQSTGRFGFRGGGGFEFGQGGQSALVKDAGLRLNRLGPVLILLGAYVVAVGPVTFFVLRRLKRLPAGWIAIPALALVGTGLVIVAGQKTRQGAAAAHATIYEVSPAGADAHVTALVMARSPGERGVKLPAGWLPTVSPFGFGFGFDGTASKQRYIDEGSMLGRRLASGQAATMAAAGPIGAPADRLAVEAKSTANGQVTGTVRNSGSTDLADVAVFADSKAILIGSLAAGSEKSFTIDRATVGSTSGGPAAQVWRTNINNQFGPQFATTAAPFGPDGAPLTDDTPAPPEPSAADLTSWSQFNFSRSLGRDRGTARATGWRLGVKAPITTMGGASIDAGRIAVTVEAPIIPTGRVTDVSVKREWIQGDTQPGPQGTVGTIVRFTLPPIADVDRRPLEFAAARLTSVTVWNGMAWVELAAKADRVPVPAEAIDHGVVLVKTTFNLGNEQGVGSRDLAIRERP
jgi:hypothetical protein